MPTVLAVFVPTCCAMFSTRLVFPIDGRAATMTRSEGWRPDVSSSRSVKPVGTPVTSSLRACSFSIVSRLDCARSRSDTNPSRTLSSAIAKMACSAWSRITSASSSPWYAVARILLAEKIRLPEGRLLLDDAGVVLDVHRARHAVHERGDVGRAADLVQIAGPPQLLLEGDEVDRIVALGQLHHLVEDAPVRVAVEIVRIDHLGREVEGLVVQQDRRRARTAPPPGCGEGFVQPRRRRP